MEAVTFPITNNNTNRKITGNLTKSEYWIRKQVYMRLVEEIRTSDHYLL